MTVNDLFHSDSFNVEEEFICYDINSHFTNYFKSRIVFNNIDKIFYLLCLKDYTIIASENDFKNYIIRSQNIDRVGEVRYNNVNAKMEIIEYFNARNITILFEFESINECSRKLKIYLGNISRVLNGIYKHTNGYVLRRK